MDPWAWWLAAMTVFAVAEVSTTSLVFGMFSAGALGALVTDVAGGGVLAQGIVFAVVSLALLLVVRPVAKRHLYPPLETRTGVAALVGTRGLVLERVDAHSGRVKLGGEVWSARSYTPSDVIESGRNVEVLQIDGATAVVLETEF
jgi:membrane protein implicated in regulation of membrane protease activity